MAASSIALGGRSVFAVAFLSVTLVMASGCRGTRTTDMSPLDKAGVWFTGVEELRKLNLNDAEVQQLILARQAGFSDEGGIELVQIARAREETFADGQAAANLLRAGMRESSVIEMARLNQLGLRAGEAQAMRLARLTDDVVLAIARRRAAGQPSLSGAGATALQNAGFSESQLLVEINRGMVDSEAEALIARRNAAAARGFVRPTGRRR
jgi:hypothetical protein